MAAATTGAAVQGYREAGVVSTTKHFPGHGGVTQDSHHTLPVLPSSLSELRDRDLKPFTTAVEQGAGAIMVGHLDVAALAPGEPSTLQPEVYDFLRSDLGFEGVAITDSMGMGAVVWEEFHGLRALQAGADLLLMPADTRSTHGTLTAAIESGRLSRDRAEEAAARVVAVQLWQQRTAARTPVPPDIADRAAAAADGLAEAAYR